MSPTRRTSPIALLLALGVLAPSGVARAAPASAGDFTIYYYTTDEDGDRGRRMTQQDLQRFVNRARCECGQKIEATIQLRSMSGMAFDQQRIRTYVGTMCGAAQAGNNTQNRRCVQLEDELPNFYTKTPSFFFEPIWLSSGVADPDVQSLAEATPFDDCAGGFGEGGIWICVEDGMQTDCQSAEFIITGTTNANVTDGMSSGIQFDYDPPLSLPTNYRTSAADGAVEVKWDFEITGDVSGYRVLCANADGTPVDGKGMDAPSITARSQGNVYFTKENLCPDGPFGQGGGAGTDDGGTGGSDDGSGTTGGSDDGRGTGTTGAGLDDFDQGGMFGGLSTGSSGSGSGSGSGTGGTDGGATSTGTSTGTDTGTEPPTGDVDVPAGEGIRSLDWSYVCSGHIPANSSSKRVDGLDNGKEYQFLVVAYDLAGNPIEASGVLLDTPRETYDLWEQCERQGDVCGDGGFCACTTDPDRAPGGGLPWLVGLLALGWRRRR